MNKFILTAAFAMVLSAGAASAAVLDTPSTINGVDLGRQHQAQRRSAHARGMDTDSAETRNDGPASSVAGYADDDPRGSAQSGLPHNPHAPGAGSSSGGGR